MSRARNRFRELGAAVLCALFGLTALSATASAVTESATSGQVVATLAYEATPAENSPYGKHVSNPQLTIARGQQSFGSPVTSQLPNCQEEGCVPLSVAGLANDSVQVSDIESNGEPDVLLHLWSGGAHCCFIDQVFSWSTATSTYSRAERSWGNERARLIDLPHNGQLEFLSADDNFAYFFASFARSGFPVQVFIFRAGAFVDVSRSYPTLLTTDARKWFRAYLASVGRSEGLGYLAAWVADEYRVGNRAHALQTLRRENRLGHLREATLSGCVNRGGAFIAQLKRLLRKSGYG